MADDFIRSLPFTFTRDADAPGDGLTLEGYAAVFNSATRISDHLGDYDEMIVPGAFKQTLRAKTPVLMFEHGQHPLYGSLPIGAISELEEDPTGLFLRARLFDTWLNDPLASAIRDKALNGMSFRFSVPPGKDSWEKQRNGGQLRTIREVKLYELGPVVFPAYADTTLALRSLQAKDPHIFDALTVEREEASTDEAETGTPKPSAAEERNNGDGAAQANEPAPEGGHSSLSMTPAERKRFARQLMASRLGVGKK